MTGKPPRIPKFKNETEEADWWASDVGRSFVKSKASQGEGSKIAGSSLVAHLNKKSIQIALRLPEADLERARKIAERKGIGYQTLLKMIVREGLNREAQRR